MRTSTVVVVVNILFQNTPQMSLVEDEDMIEALLSDGSHPTLGMGIGVGRLVRSGNDTQPFASEDGSAGGVESGSEFAIVVVNQETPASHLTVSANTVFVIPSGVLRA